MRVPELFQDLNLVEEVEHKEKDPSAGEIEESAASLKSHESTTPEARVSEDGLTPRTESR